LPPTNASEPPRSQLFEISGSGRNWPDVLDCDLCRGGSIECRGQISTWEGVKGASPVGERPSVRGEWISAILAPRRQLDIQRKTRAIRIDRGLSYRRSWTTPASTRSRRGRQVPLAAKNQPRVCPVSFIQLDAGTSDPSPLLRRRKCHVVE